MKKEELISKKIAIAEKAVQELVQAESLKRLEEQTARQIADFYETKSFNRIQTAKYLYEISKDPKKYNLPQNYTDYSEVVSAAYYAMYYIVHAFIAANYQTKLHDDVRGVHAITHNLIVYYLVKTKKLAQHLYNEYVKTLETASAIQDFTVESFRKKLTNMQKDTIKAGKHEKHLPIKQRPQSKHTMRSILFLQQKNSFTRLDN